ncbi:MAG: CvpA family protein [Clostridiales bacterium]|nr:CvpA family protein [Clostridiales bacterium]
MNVVDIIILLILACGLLSGLYRGFIHSVLNLGSGLLSFLISFALYPKLADVVSGNPDIIRMISSFTDSESLLGDLDLSNRLVSALNPENISAIVEKANLPEPIGTLLGHNLAGQVFSPLGNLATNVGDYVNQTVISVSINVLCFLVCFLLSFVVLTIFANLIRAVFRFPVLKQLDTLVGGIFGLLTSVLVCFALLTLLPLLESVVPLPGFREAVDSSVLAGYFTNGSLIISIMNRKL